METYPLHVWRVDVIMSQHLCTCIHKSIRKLYSQSQPTASLSFELGCAVGTVPSIPRKLVFALLNPTLCAHLHASCIGEIGLQRRRCYHFFGLITLWTFQTNPRNRVFSIYLGSRHKKVTCHPEKMIEDKEWGHAGYLKHIEKTQAVSVVSYQAFPGHILYKRDRSQNKKCTIFIYTASSHSRDLLILTSAATFSFIWRKNKWNSCFIVPGVREKLIGCRVQETPICALQRMALGESLFFFSPPRLYDTRHQYTSNVIRILLYWQIRWSHTYSTKIFIWSHFQFKKYI